MYFVAHLALGHTYGQKTNKKFVSSISAGRRTEKRKQRTLLHRHRLSRT
jgi:hypothetical protein